MSSTTLTANGAPSQAVLIPSNSRVEFEENKKLPASAALIFAQIVLSLGILLQAAKRLKRILKLFEKK